MTASFIWQKGGLKYWAMFDEVIDALEVIV
jgi:hypothetical protein